MANAKHVELSDKFISINPDASQQGRVPNIEDHFRCRLHRLCISLQWMNESINKDNWKSLRQRQWFSSISDSMVRLYQVSLSLLALISLTSFVQPFISSFCFGSSCPQ